MREFLPSISSHGIVCEEITAPPCGLVVFGASGDLTRRKLLVSLFKVFRRGLLNERFYLLGVSRKNLTGNTGKLRGYVSKSYSVFSRQTLLSER
jgi:glucose-6-phosphate 1-dehydrogenase